MYQLSLKDSEENFKDYNKKEYKSIHILENAVNISCQEGSFEIQPQQNKCHAEKIRNCTCSYDLKVVWN